MPEIIAWTGVIIGVANFALIAYLEQRATRFEDVYFRYRREHGRHFDRLLLEHQETRSLLLNHLEDEHNVKITERTT